MDFDTESSKKPTGRLDKLEGRMQKVEGDVSTIQVDMRMVRANQDTEIQRGVTRDLRAADLCENMRTLIAAVDIVKAATTGAPTTRAAKRPADEQLQRTEGA